MKVILTQDVRGKGKRGQMIEVSDGYARNFLLPKKLAQEATADNVNTMRMNDKALAERQAKERAEALAQQQGIQLDKRKIVLDEPIKQTGLYTVKCKLGYEINAELKIEVKEA